MPKYLTKEAFDKFKKELEYLKDVKRKEIGERIRAAAAFGDLKENFAYHEAKEAQGFLEGRISELRKMLSESKVLETKSGGTAQLGSTVILKSGGDTDRYQIVEPEEADILSGKISAKSPLGKSIIGKSKGDKIKFEAPNGLIEYEITGIE